MYHNLKYSTIFSALMTIAASAAYYLTGGNLALSAFIVLLLTAIAVIAVIAVAAHVQAAAFTALAAAFVAGAASATIVVDSVADIAIPIIFVAFAAIFAVGTIALAVEEARRCSATEPAWAIFFATMQGTNIILGWPLWWGYFRNRHEPANTTTR